MGEVDTFGDLLEDAYGVRTVQPVRCTSRRERHAFQQLHDEVGHATSFLDTEIHDVNDVRVLQVAEGGSLDSKSIAESLTRTGHELDCDLPVKIDMPAPIDNPHPAFAKPPLELVLAVQQPRAGDRRFERRTVIRASVDRIVCARATEWAFFQGSWEGPSYVFCLKGDVAKR